MRDLDRGDFVTTAHPTRTEAERSRGGWLRPVLSLALVAGLVVGCAGWWHREKPRGLWSEPQEESLGLRLLWPLPLDTHKPVKDIYLLPDLLCVLTRDNTFIALDPRKGFPLWQQLFEDEVRDRGAVDDGHLYLVVGNRLFTIDRRTGAVKNERALKFVATSAPAVDQAFVYLGSAEGRLYALDLGPKLGWHHTVGGAVKAQPQVDGAGVYFASADGRVYAVDPADGARKWEFATDGPIEADLLLSHNVLLVGSTDGRLYALDTALGASRKQQQRWPLPYSTGGRIVQAPVLRGDTVFVTAEETGVHAVRADTGEGLWQVPQADTFIAAGDDRAYLGAKGRYLICVDRHTGKVLWQRRLPGRHRYLFVTNGDSDLIYICRQKDGALYCYQPR